MTKIIGVDPGAHCGWCVIDDGRYIDSGCMQLRHDDLCGAEALGTIAATYRVDVLAIEEPILQYSPQSTITLARLAGAIEYAVVTATVCRVVRRKPSQWRSLLDIRGGGSVDLKMRAVLHAQTLGVECYDTDEAEAICIAYAEHVHGGTR